MPGHFDLVVMGFDFDVHQIFDFHGIEVAADHHAQIIGDEFHHVMVVGNRRIFAENRTFVGIFDIVFNRHQTFLAHFREHFEKHRQKINIGRLVVFRPLEEAGQRAHGSLDNLDVITGKEAAKRQTDDRHIFKRHP